MTYLEVLFILWQHGRVLLAFALAQALGGRAPRRHLTEEALAGVEPAGVGANRTLFKKHAWQN